MYSFALEYDNGYVVKGRWADDYGQYRWHPLRNFGEHEGMAKHFRIYDCPKLDDKHLKALAKMFDPKVIYIRINEHCFRPDKTIVQLAPGSRSTMDLQQ